MELTDYLRVLRAYWRGVAAFVLLGVAVAAAVSLVQPKVYQADASGFVSAGTTSSAGEASVGDSLAKSRAASYVDLAKSRATAQTVISDLGLDGAPASLIGAVSVSQPLDTVLIKISARAVTPRSAQQLADAWVQALKQQVDQVENPSGSSTQALRIVPIESAALPSSPVSPNTTRNIGLGFVGGLLLGTAYAVRAQPARPQAPPGGGHRARVRCHRRGHHPGQPGHGPQARRPRPAGGRARPRSRTRCTRPRPSSSSARTCSSWTSTTRRG